MRSTGQRHERSMLGLPAIERTCRQLHGTLVSVSRTAEPALAPVRSERAGMLPRGPRLALVTGVALAVMVAVTAGLALRWWSHPDVFGEQGGAGDFVADPRPVSEAQMTFAVA